MNNLPKYVLDTNIIVSALLFKNSQPRQALDKFLELAVNGNAELIVSGDEDLLILNYFQEIAIVTVRQFLEME